MSNDILALANAAAEYSTDMTEATTGGGGGDYVPPAEGLARARFIGYIESGVHEKNVGPGKPPVIKPQVQLVFELSGPLHPPTIKEDGTKLPHRVTVDFNASPNYGPLNEKAGLYKAFKRMNYEGKAKHMSQLLGTAYLLQINHNKKKGTDGKERTYVKVQDEGGLLIQPPRFVNPLDNTVTPVPVDEPISPLRLFVWNAAPEVIGKMWDSLFIDGEYPERKNDKGEVTAKAKSKNVLQNEIKAALNFTNSPVFQYLQTKGVPLNLGAQVEAGKGAVAADPLAATSGSTPKAADASDPLALM